MSLKRKGNGFYYEETDEIVCCKDCGGDNLELLESKLRYGYNPQISKWWYIYYCNDCGGATGSWYTIKKDKVNGKLSQ